MTPEALPDSITPESLTRALRRSGVLGKGAVSAVEGENARSTILSRNVLLRLAYEGEAAGAPAALIFKTGLPERLTGGWNGGRQEVRVLRQDRRRNPSGNPASMLRGGVGREDERLAAPARRPRGVA